MSRGAVPYGRQSIDDADVDAVVEVLRSDRLTQGPEVPSFEEEVAEFCGAERGVAVSSGTAALHLACLALDIGPGDVVWTSSVTFVASANCARYCGADVDFVDIDPDTWNLSVEALAAKLEGARASGSRMPKVVIPVHLAGRSCDMAGVAALAEEFGFRVVEDATHALGGHYRDAPVGSCRYGDIVVFSFHPVKVLTTGEGGMALTDDAGLADRMVRLRSHGITRDPEEMRREPEGPWSYDQVELGFNYRMSDIHAALGRSQLRRIDDFVRRRRSLAQGYRDRLGDLPIRHQEAGDDVRSAWHLYVVRVPERHHRALFDHLRVRGIEVNLHYTPVHLQPYYGDLGFRTGDLPEAEAYGREAITLPLYPSMSDEDQDRVIRETIWWWKEGDGRV